MASEPLEDLNAGFVQELLAEYLNAPGSLDPAWRAYFESAPPELVSQLPALQRLRGNGAAAPAAAEEAPPQILLGAVAAGMALVKAHRMHGHLAARLDPLGSEPMGDPALDPDRLEPRLTPELQRQVPAKLLRMYVPGETLEDALPRLRETYCGTMAYEIEHISAHDQRVWLRRAIESGDYRKPLSPEEKRALLVRLTEAEGFERYLRRAFLGQKQFSLEGLDAMVPMLDEAIRLAAAGGAQEVHIGMAHRGRLNVLAHTLGRPYEDILREFEGERELEAVSPEHPEEMGDVKYHLGAEGMRQAPGGDVEVILAANPSHLEAVNPVVEGETRAAQTDRGAGAGEHDAMLALAVLIHGDAAFPAQGVVAETLNLQDLPGYGTGGTLHLIANNQVGFTTDPEEGRSTRYSSDLAKGFDVPIVHVNADDPEAALFAIRLAMAYRERFAQDVVVDIVGYRRLGHNEQDEPAYTQPLMYRAIAEHPTVRELYAGALAGQGIVPQAEAAELESEVERRMKERHEALRAELAAADGPAGPRRAQRTVEHRTRPRIATAVPAERLRELSERLLAVPEGFTVHPKLRGQLERRRDALGPEGEIDWGHAEALAFASLIGEGVPVRLTGQDSERGTFSHRHLVLHDAVTGERYAPIQHLPGTRASLEVHNSPLSEYATVGFEYGYSVAVPNGLVVWEAQFGDFVNGAQIVVDQFIVSGFVKWTQTSRLTLLLPHGYEGSGPEHSSARVERFLSLAAQGNIRIANCSTPAQYFHLLRLQALGSTPRPLVVFTPKSLLRARQAISRLDELSSGSFRPIFDDPRMGGGGREDVRRLLLCSGKVYYDVAGNTAYAGKHGLAVARLEQLYPFPVPTYADLLRAYPAVEEVVWVQEEPQNMGPYRSIRHRLEESLSPGVRLGYAGRPWRASPSEGYPTAHVIEQERIVQEALGV